MDKMNRKNTRFVANFDGYYRLANDPVWEDCYIYDISETGALLRIKQSLIIGDKLEICLDIDNKKDAIHGVVANVQGQVAGVKFETTGVDEIVDRALDRAFSKSRTEKKRYGI